MPVRSRLRRQLALARGHDCAVMVLFRLVHEVEGQAVGAAQGCADRPAAAQLVRQGGAQADEWDAHEEGDGWGGAGWRLHTAAQWLLPECPRPHAARQLNELRLRALQLLDQLFPRLSVQHVADQGA